MRLIIALLALTLAGCELVQTRARTDDEKNINHDCVLTHHDGTTLSCSQTIIRDQGVDEKDTGASVVMPVPEAGP